MILPAPGPGPIAYGAPGAAAFQRLGHVVFREVVETHVAARVVRANPGLPKARTDLAGVSVRVLPPIRAAEAPMPWACDSELLWQIHPEDVPRVAGRDPGIPVYVCEHQVDLD